MRLVTSMPEQEHPDFEWAETVMRKCHPDVTEAEIFTLVWDSNMKCYLVKWKGMTLGIEKDGNIHS